MAELAQQYDVRPNLIRADPPKAMITILAPGDYDRWLTGDCDDVLALQRPFRRIR